MSEDRRDAVNDIDQWKQNDTVSLQFDYIDGALGFISMITRLKKHVIWCEIVCSICYVVRSICPRYELIDDD